MRETFYAVKRSSAAPLSHNIEDYPEGIVIVLDKPYRWTSADAVRKIKFRLQKHFGKKNIKVGHAGTLDPLATGILLICIGKATKKAEALQAEQKEYIATIRFGATTPSYDCEKEIDQTYPYEHITQEQLSEICKSFIGEQDQIPPVFSAKLIDGVRAYNIARKGNECEMKPARITIYDMEIIKFESPVLTLRIQCSKGTYIRAIARDLGTAAGSGAYLTDLRRTGSGAFGINESITMEDCEKIFENSQIQGTF